MAVLGRDNRVSLWLLGPPRNENELPSVECFTIIPGPGDSVLLTGRRAHILMNQCASYHSGRLWSNMLVFWLQKIVSVESSGQSRVFSVTGAMAGPGAGAGARDQWQSHGELSLVREARPGDTGAVRSIR